MLPTHRRSLLLLLPLLGVAFLVLPGAWGQEQDRLPVGQQADGRVIVPTNQVLTPAGQQVLFAGRPVDLLLTDEGRTLVLKNLKDLVIIDVPTRTVKQTLVSPVGFSVVGLVAQEGRLYVTDARDHLRIARARPDGTYAWEEPIALAKPKVGGLVHPAGIAVQGPQRLWVTATRGNCVQLVNVAMRRVEQVVDVGVAPYMPCCPRPDRCYVSNWGGDRPAAGDRQALSAGTPTRVDARGIASQGTVSVLAERDGAWRQVKTIPVGLHPSGMTASPDGRFVYVANANSDTVSVLRTDTEEVVETIACRPEGRLPFGSGCNAVALSPQGDVLYVANGTNNCIAVVQLGARACTSAGGRPPASQLTGLIPTGWYPGAVQVSADGGRLLVANVKGVGSLSRRRPADKEPRPPEKGRNSHDHLGSVSLIDTPGAKQLEDYTRTVNANNRLAYSLTGLEKPRPDARSRPVPERHGEPSTIKHVLYVIKENRTYDQVFGDVKEGNGDPALCLFGEEVSPNHHKLAREFTLFDNFYCSGVLSADGHQWVNEAYVTDYLEKAFGGFTRSYPYEGSDPLAFASSGFLWDNALARGRTVRNYGEFVKAEAPRGSTWTAMYNDYRTGARTFQVQAHVNVRALEPYTHPGYPGFAMGVPDVYRAQIFLEEFKTFEQKGELPNLIYVSLPCDHTSGTRPGMPTPRAMVADNDLALGRIVEAVSRSRFWKQTAIFVVEDDPQNGFDHVDAHRTVALVISPYTKRRFVDSTCYNQTSMVKTIELILGLSPMNQMDLSATAMRACFQETADLSPYTAVPNRIPLDEMNPPLKDLKGQALHWARKSQELALDAADEADEDTLNRILWHAVHEQRPYPEHFAGRRQEEP